MPLPIGCPSIMVPIDVRADDCWFAGLFRVPRRITQLKPKALFESVSSFLPYLVEQRMAILPVSLKSFHLDNQGSYLLTIPGSNLRYNITQEEAATFRGQLARLLPGNERHRHAMLDVADLYNLPRHPANWSLDEDMHFLISFVAEDPLADLGELEGLIIGGDWTLSSKLLKADAKGKAKRGKGSKKTAAAYDTKFLNDLCRYVRNKLIHFDELDQSLKDHFGGSRRKLLAYFNNLVKGNDLVFSVWKVVNGKVPSMRRFWVL